MTALPPSEFSREIGFVHFRTATYRIEIDARRKRAHVRSEIELELVGEDGELRHPVIDFANPDSITSITLDGEEAWWDRITSPPPGRAARYMVLDRPIAADGKKHRVVIEHDLDLAEEVGEGDGSLIFFRMSHAKHYEPGSPGRDKDRLFLERYLPTNLEFDQHLIQLEVVLENARRDYLLFTNGTVTGPGLQNDLVPAGQAIQIDFPDWFTCSSPFFFIGRRSRIHRQRIPAPAGHAGVWPQIVLFGRRPEMRRHARKIIGKVQRHLPDLMDASGLGPHPLWSGADDKRPLLLFLGQHGIEYVSAAEVTAGNVLHELVHMYIGRYVLPRDGNAGWFDEAVAHWFESGCEAYEQPPDEFGAKLGAGDPYRRATDQRARSLGPLVLGHLDHVMRTTPGQPKTLMEFLRVLIVKRGMDTLSSEDLKHEVIAFHGKAASEIDRIFGDYIL